MADVFGDDILTLLRQAADDYLPCPASWRMAMILRCSTDCVRRTMNRQEEAGLYRVECQGGGLRRAVFPDGAMTDWTQRSGHKNPVYHVLRPQDIDLPPIPPDTRDLTGRICGDPIQPVQHEAWEPVYETASVTLPRLSFLDGASA